MLDQNTDRMWYVIGAVIIGAAIIFILNGTMPELFASVGGTFKDKTDDVTDVVADIKSNTSPVEIRGQSTMVGVPSMASPAAIQNQSDIELPNGDVITLSNPLRSIGDVHDRIFLDVDGVWKVERHIKELVFNSALLMGTYMEHERNPAYKIVYRRAVDKLNHSPYVSSHFNAEYSAMDWDKVPLNQNLLVESNANQPLVGIVVDTTTFPTLESFNAWLLQQNAAGTPVVMQYQLRSSTIDVLSSVYQAQLNTAFEIGTEG